MAVKHFITSFLLVFLGLPAIGQVTLEPKQEDQTHKGIIYDTEFVLNFTFHTNGFFALGTQFGQLQTYYKTTFFHFKFGELRHHKEHRQNFDNLNTRTGQSSRTFVYGKQNNFFALRGGYGEKRYFSEKYTRKGLAVGISYQGGVSLGLLKPYYLEIKRVNDGTNKIITSEKYSEANADLFLDFDRIFGASPFSKGLDEIKIQPGVHLAAAAHFDWGAFDEFVTALEFGIMADIYFKKIPIMVNVENKPIFLNLYINLQLGKRS